MNKITPIDRIFEKYVLFLIPKSITPNQVTVVRFLLTPVVVYFLITASYIPGFVLFLITALTDALDGAMARVRDQITDWGKTYDPFADKLLVLAVAYVIVPKFLNGYLLAAITFIEVLLLANKLYLEKIKGSKIIQANFYGKIKMIMYCIGLGSLIAHILSTIAVFLLLAKIFLFASLIPAFISLVMYRSV